MRRFGLGLQLALLVSCGVASGYAWRAALSHGDALQTQYIYTGKPFAPAWFSSPPSARVVPSRRAPTNRHPKVRRAINADAAPTSSSGKTDASASRQLASVTTSAHAASSSPSPAPPAPRDKGPAHPKHHWAPPPPPPPASPQPPPPPPPTPPPPPAPPSPPQLPSAPVVQTTADKGSRPGWGRGDPNHTHTGPPGKGSKSEAQPSSAAPRDDQSKGKGRSK